jgi:hypothetical protein
MLNTARGRDIAAEEIYQALKQLKGAGENWQFGQGTDLGQGSAPDRSSRWVPGEIRSRDEAAAYTDRVFAELLGPETFQADADGGKNRHMEHCEQRFRNIFGGREVQRDAAKAEVDHASAPDRLISQDGVSIGAGHRNAFSFARDSVNASFFGSEWERGKHSLQR